MSNLPASISENDPQAPWNLEQIYCPHCLTVMTETDSGQIKRISWKEYTCDTCGFKQTNEPEID